MEIKAQEMLTIEYGDVYYLTCAEYSSLWFDHHLMPLISLSELFRPNWITSNYTIFLFTPVQNPPSELRPCCLLPSPSPHRCHPLRFCLWVIAVFAYAFSFASSLSSYRSPSSIQQLKNDMA
ncbi:hypothetical protein OUZ56_013596 [Daphnia magna]|uniref:Uncharacterized protein n=1 Tax=Daphnia magna TaxID=35525 RepID=A0ABQ9Z6F2_9CRUS|nr:hypothetical protein OUZ56_013596 [Daphnia magna]